EHHADARLEAGRVAHRVQAQHADGPGVGRGEALAHLHGGGLAGAVGPQQRQDGAGRHRQIQPVDGGDGPVPPHGARQLYGGRGGGITFGRRDGRRRGCSGLHDLPAYVAWSAGAPSGGTRVQGMRRRVIWRMTTMVTSTASAASTITNGGYSPPFGVGPTRQTIAETATAGTRNAGVVAHAASGTSAHSRYQGCTTGNRITRMASDTPSPPTGWMRPE